MKTNVLSLIKHKKFILNLGNFDLKVTLINCITSKTNKTLHNNNQYLYQNNVIINKQMS